MEPIPETARAIEQYGPFVIEDTDLLLELLEQSERVQAVVPQLLGLSLSSNEDGVTFTLVATDREAALLDAMQYVGDGPCLEAVRRRETLGYEHEQLFSEDSWRLFAEASAAAGVSSTLSLPILEGDRVIGNVNLYAATPDAFDGHHESVARVFRAWAPGAVANADLSFSSRETAAEAPDLLRDEVDLAVASGMIAARERIDIEEAGRRLHDAALRAGVSDLELARTVIELQRPQEHG